MGWRVHLANQAIQRLHFLGGKSPVLAVWTRADMAHFYDVQSGALLQETHYPPVPTLPFSSDAWQEYVGALVGYDPRTYVPMVRARATDVYITDDGKFRLYYQNDRELIVDNEGMITPLEVDAQVERFTALDLDRHLGTIAALDQRGRLHLYQQDIALGAYELGLHADEEARFALAMARGGNVIYLSDGRQLLAVSADGEVSKRLETHYRVGGIACSPSGAALLVSDAEAGVLRVYEGERLALPYQKHAIDLIAAATQLQLLADLPPLGTTISSLAMYAQGICAFAMSGVVCCADVSEMDEIPRPKSMF